MADNTNTIDASVGQVWGATANRLAQIDAQTATTNAGQIGGAIDKNGQLTHDGLSIINTSNLTSTPALTLPSTTPTGNPAAAIISTSQANADAQAKAEATVAKETASLQPLQDQKQGYLDKIKGFIGLETTAQNQAVTDNTAIDPYRKDLADINKTIADTTVAYRGEKDAIMGNGSITKEGQQSLLSNVESKYGRQLADLAIRQSAAQGNVSALEASADRKLKLTLAPIETQIAYYKDFLLSNNDQLTKDEKDKINMIISEKDKLIKQHTDEQNTATEAFKLASSNGVRIPDTVVQEINANPGQAYTILANNNISLENPIDKAYKAAQTAKLYADINTANNSVTIKRVGPNGETLPPTPTDTALQVILGSGKFTVAQSKAVSNAINNGEDAFTVIKNQAKNIMGQTEATTVTKYETAQGALNDLKTALNSYYANGGKTNIFSGNYEKVINKLGEVNDPKLVDLATQIQAQLQIYRNAVSGTAYSAQEGADINTIFPGINKSKGLNDAILKGRESAFNSTIDSTYRATLGSSYDSLKKGEASGQPPTTTQSGKSFDVDGAKAAGYTDADIYEYLRTH